MTTETIKDFETSKEVENIVQKLIDGDTVSVSDEQRKEVQQRLREIKNNCTIVLKQLKEGL